MSTLQSTLCVKCHAQNVIKCTRCPSTLYCKKCSFKHPNCQLVDEKDVLINKLRNELNEVRDIADQYIDTQQELYKNELQTLELSTKKIEIERNREQFKTRQTIFAMVAHINQLERVIKGELKRDEVGDINNIIAGLPESNKICIPPADPPAHKDPIKNPIKKEIKALKKNSKSHSIRQQRKDNLEQSTSKRLHKTTTRRVRNHPITKRNG